MQNHSYFIFGSLFDYCDAMCYDLTKRDDCQFINTKYFTDNKLVYFIYKVHRSRIANKLFRLPFQTLWYKHYFDVKKINNSGGGNFFVFFDSNPYVYDPKFLQWIQSDVPNAVCALIFVNTMKTRKMRDIDYFHKFFKYLYTIDRSDADEYGFDYVEGIHSKLPLSVVERTSDVCFTGSNKGREDKLVYIYDLFGEKGLRCDFTIIGGTQKRDGISHVALSYIEALKHQLSSRYILELCVGEQNANTLRSLEAIMYDRSLITNNKNVLQSKYYDPRRMFFFKDVMDLKDVHLPAENDEVPYGYENDYSPNRVLERLAKRWEEDK